jgi:hypothetical protein
VLTLYRDMLRAVATKATESQPAFKQHIDVEFRKHDCLKAPVPTSSSSSSSSSSSVKPPRKVLDTIKQDYLLRTGQRQLKLLRMPSVTKMS